jgi:hypothetical protein
MYPDDFSDLDFDELGDWRTRILQDLHEVEEEAIDAGIDPDDIERILLIGMALGKVESELQNYSD